MDAHKPSNIQRPEILAPAGSRPSFLAAVAAGADAVYCGLKQLSARMAAKNFTIDELASLAAVARHKGVRVYVAINSVIRPDEIDPLAGVLTRLQTSVAPDAIIVQDLGVVRVAQKIGLSAEIHLSTLANVSFPAALSVLPGLYGVRRVVVPRELNIEEVKSMANACPEGIDLEVFVHGALCYSVSGRCYWSSYLGGKSGLRGQCVQPCRRLYRQEDNAGRFFSCRDLSLDVLARTLLPVARIAAWKIEGRKKGPHYVFYTVRAYRMMRDFPDDTAARKEAVAMLDYALGRKTTHYFFLPQRPWNPIPEDGQTGSGLLVGRVKRSDRRLYFRCREELLDGDMLRIGFEDDPWHRLLPVKRGIPRKGKFFLPVAGAQNPPPGTPLFLIDRREKELAGIIEKLTPNTTEKTPSAKDFSEPIRPPAPRRKKGRGPVKTLFVYRTLSRPTAGTPAGYWLETVSYGKIKPKQVRAAWWWLSPVIWPDTEKRTVEAVKNRVDAGARHFVLNAPWQISFFDQVAGLELWAGPFCNISNPAAFHILKSMGFHGCIVSPELDRERLSMLPVEAPFPLGIVISGSWPLCISRVVPPAVTAGRPFYSPHGEAAWMAAYDANTWVFPNWLLDLEEKKEALTAAGYQMLVRMVEPIPKGVKLKERPGVWNYHSKSG